MAENKTVTLNVRNKYGIAHVQFEMLKDLGNNKHLLFTENRLCIGILGATGLWRIIKVADLLDFNLELPVEEMICNATIS